MQRSLALWFSVAALVAVAPFAGCSSSSTNDASTGVDASGDDSSVGSSNAADTGSATLADASTSDVDAGDASDQGDPVYSGIQTCATMLASGWDPHAVKSDFNSQAAYDAFVALNDCGCVRIWATNGCGTVCDDAMGSPNPNFCNGVTMLTNCRWCLQGVGNGQGPSNLCGDVYDTCNAN